MVINFMEIFRIKVSGFQESGKIWGDKNGFRNASGEITELLATIYDPGMNNYQLRYPLAI